MEWFSWVVAIILLISSIASPWLVTKENNAHQLDLKKLDIYELQKRKALEEFIECAQDCLLNKFYTEQNVKYHASLNKLFLYFSNIDINTFKKFDAYYKNDDIDNATNELTNIVQVLSEQIKKE